MSGMLVDLFAGGGGASEGIERGAGRPVDLAINHCPEAIAMHAANHPRTLHLTDDVRSIDPALVTAGRSIDGLWASPDCKHFSRAKGAKPVSVSVRSLAWEVVAWARAKLPSILWLENVREFAEWGPLGADDRPIKERRGETFLEFVGALRSLGYAVEWRAINAADYGAPTHRRRLFLIARRDGSPIVWPEPTHGPGRAQPWRAAAECIDWSIPCPSIFERKRPLAEKTLRRIAAGVFRFVIDAPDPFIVPVTHGGDDRVHSIHEPLRTVTAANRGEHALCVPFIKQAFGGMVGKPAGSPLPCVTSRDHNWLVSAFLTKYHHATGAESRCNSPAEPLRTLDTQNRFGIATAFLTQFRGTSIGQDPREPIRAVTAQGTHFAEVRAFLVKYYGQGVGQSVREPLHTVTTQDRFGLVTARGATWEIGDIGLRMLTPRELARAQGFPESYILTGTKTSQVARIGNSVCPPVAEALVRANLGARPAREAA